LHNDSINVHALIHIGIAHYQFETIHPFLDGNGRIGRLLITLFFEDQNILHQPLLYLSAFFENNKSHYYDNLTRVREKGDMLHWLKYLLIGVEKTAQDSVTTLSQIIELKQNVENNIHENWGKRTRSALQLLNQLFAHPVTSVKQTMEICNLSKKAAGDLIGSFEVANILIEQTGQSRNRIFTFVPYLNLFEKNKAKNQTSI